MAGMGALVKPIALLLAPALLKREGWKAVIAPVAAAALIVSTPTAGLRAYAAHWTFNPALFRMLPVSREAALALYKFLKDDGTPQALISQCIWMFAPWYLTWMMPFAAIRRAWFWLALSASIFLSYHAYLQFAESLPLVIVEFAIPVGVWLYMRKKRVI